MEKGFLDGLRKGLSAGMRNTFDENGFTHSPEATVVYHGRDLPPPFNRPMTVATQTNVTMPFDLGVIAANGVRAMKDTCGDMCRMMLAQVDGAIHRMTGSEMRLISYVPHRIDRPRDSACIDCRGVFSLIDDALNETEMEIVFGETSEGVIGFDQLASEARSQDARRALLGQGLVTDQILARALTGMTDEGRRRLAEHLRRNPKPASGQPGHHIETWTPAALARMGIGLPKEVETIRVSDGHVKGRVRLGRGTTATSGRIFHNGDDLPQTMLATLPGRPLRDLMEHRLLPLDARIRYASVNAKGMLTINVGHRHYAFPGECTNESFKP